MSKPPLSKDNPSLTRDQSFLLAVASLEVGEVVSYGDIAERAGYPKNSRAVGRFLGTTPTDIPWWRVVRSSGHLVTADPTRQARLLIAEGVRLDPQNARVISAPLGRFS